ncbi:unnamed protein product [Acanthoscelides obtectus]|uniref:Uncharacterized protein n=1 Tax=Acanthoscelides obtectus TaxID=200917 RepID=A0A9P0LMN5_ACAOB|nr:unnamed protein product [Acanthoscelides obtectus]CAK1631032.1 hypothetical protein AOBTE_LOCUS6715 [Acanthoscelides obtectus]
MQQDEDSANIVRQTVEGVDTHEDQELASDDDFNPALLCPDVIMEVNEVPMSSNEINGISNHIHNIVNAKIQLDEDERNLLRKSKLQRSKSIKE